MWVEWRLEKRNDRVLVTSDHALSYPVPILGPLFAQYIVGRLFIQNIAGKDSPLHQNDSPKQNTPQTRAIKKKPIILHTAL